MHPFVLVGVGLLVPPSAWWLYVPLTLVTIFTVAEITLRFVEEPVLRLGRPAGSTTPASVTRAA